MNPLIVRDVHERALGVLLELTLGQEPGRLDIDAAYRHVAGCVACWDQFNKLTEGLSATKLDELTESGHQEAWLPAAPTYGEQWLLQHHAQNIMRQPGFWQRGTGYLARLAEGAVQQTTMLLVSCHQLLAGPDFAIAHRGAGATQSIFDLALLQDDHEPFELVLPCTDLPDLQTTVVLQSDAISPELVRPKVLISIPSRWPDFSGVRVILDDGTQQIERVTGRTGSLEFDAVPRSRISGLNFIVVQLPRTTM